MFVRTLSLSAALCLVALPAAGQGETSDLMRAIVDSVERVAPLGSSVPSELLLTHGNAVAPRILEEGPEIYSEMARLIRGARSEVLLQTYVWEAGSTPSRRVLDALADLERTLRRLPPREPVRVRLLSNLKPRAGRLDQAFRAEVAARGFDPRLLDVRVGSYQHRGLGALHTKSLVVDGQVAIVSGVNLEQKNEGLRPWFDTGYRVEGQVASALRADAADAWKRATGEALPKLPRASRRGGLPILTITRFANGNPFRRITSPLREAFLAAIGNARERISIQMPNLNDPATKRALVDAALRGVTVELILSRGFNDLAERLPFQGGTNQKTFDDLTRALKRADPRALTNLRLRWFSRDGVTAVEGQAPGASHTKYASFDGQVVIVGSANLDVQSVYHSREVSLVIDDAELTRRWDAQILRRSIPASATGARFARLVDALRGRSSGRTTRRAARDTAARSPALAARTARKAPDRAPVRRAERALQPTRGIAGVLGQIRSLGRSARRAVTARTRPRR